MQTTPLIKRSEEDRLSSACFLKQAGTGEASPREGGAQAPLLPGPLSTRLPTHGAAGSTSSWPERKQDVNLLCSRQKSKVQGNLA